MLGKISSLQARCKAENNKIIYVHCYAYCLNLALIDSISKKTKKKIKHRIVFDFLGTVQYSYTLSLKGARSDMLHLKKYQKNLVSN